MNEEDKLDQISEIVKMVADLPPEEFNTILVLTDRETKNVYIADNYNGMKTDLLRAIEIIINDPSGGDLIRNIIGADKNNTRH